jgi:predicted cupin superfamily sugar epimerase
VSSGLTQQILQHDVFQHHICHQSAVKFRAQRPDWPKKVVKSATVAVLGKGQKGRIRSRYRWAISADKLRIMKADQIIARLCLAPHPEGGHYRQTWTAEMDGRPSGTCIYFLLKAGEVSHWHKVDATEIWHYHSGGPLVLSLSPDTIGPAIDHLLTPDLNQGTPQIIVPATHWQAARSTDAYTLVSCTVSPGFEFSGFTLAPQGFDIPRA